MQVVLYNACKTVVVVVLECCILPFSTIKVVVSQQRDDVITQSWIICRNLNLRRSMTRSRRVISWVRLRTSCAPSAVAERTPSLILPSRNRFSYTLSHYSMSSLNPRS